MSTFLLNIVGLLLIGFIVWWFWLSKPKAKQAKHNKIRIIVKDGVYNPARIEVQAGQPISLKFVRQDTSGCSEYLLIDKLGIHEKLPIDIPHEVKLGKLNPGKYEFTCQMKMYIGNLEVISKHH